MWISPGVATTRGEDNLEFDAVTLWQSIGTTPEVSGNDDVPFTLSHARRPV
jgi:hypothetical protein